MEPPVKKLKMVNNTIIHTIDSYIKTMKENTKSLHVVLSDDYHKPLPLVKVYVGHIKNPKDISKIILTLNEKIPLKELPHLKRVRKKEVLLCPTYFLNGTPSIQEYLVCNVPELMDSFEYFKVIDVPRVAPKLRKQFSCQVWSCNFHPNKYYEKLVSDDFFIKTELDIHIMFMEVAFEIAKWHLEMNSSPSALAELLENINATIIVDPLITSVVALAYCNNEHPLQHSTMLAIDNVAKTQNGGVWCPIDDSKEQSVLPRHLKDIFPKLKFGARPYQSKRAVAKEMSETTHKRHDEGETSSSSDGPYLCTGYYVYMLKEPCIMCSMALVHARAKRVFFCFNNSTSGGLNSRTKLQAVPSLNHHFEVFTGFL